MSTAWTRGRAELNAIAATVDLREPLAAYLWTQSEDRSPERALALIAHVAKREPGHITSESRYRWELSHRRGTPPPPYAPTERWRAWRTADQVVFERDRFEAEQKLLLPLATCGYLDLFVATRDEHLLAAQLFDEAIAVFRRDLGRCVLADDPFADTLMLRTLAQRPALLSELGPLAVAIGSTYASAGAAPVCGNRFPYLSKPLVSATAQLATGLLVQGLHLPVVAEQLAWLLGAQRDDGGWADGDADAETDVISTLAASSLLASLVPELDFSRVLDYFAAAQGDDGLWRGLGPDAPWVTAEVLAIEASSRAPFAERFQWPFVAPSHRDRKTGLPSFGHFLELTELFCAVETLSRARVELAFIDLIGFRDFNNLHGQDMGDAVLERFGETIASISGIRAIRDGGDEFLIVGAPTRTDLDADLDTLLDRWPLAFRAAFGDTAPVAPRILVSTGVAGELRGSREHLGRAITETKTRKVDPARGFVLRI